ncbi:transmembrane protein, putative (macronuclear) [Tetrahymena thermophila SB210]|uniref:Transmembrane protein, putative n=1 Tax=Tetrahymena thermophila (strain SB210) TaxID=312017 RepID=Q23YB3_TETTS|nr:transmembrane protein, putative [Tetrahymena thermophila SB210]EAS01551.2 transmembrane protein, putative [Tetrahymena thermophila SB210]|eukprot:XP_001021796.2 transmembrane protein, putative [Tetrahymena thermophila SB210]
MITKIQNLSHVRTHHRLLFAVYQQPNLQQLLSKLTNLLFRVFRQLILLLNFKYRLMKNSKLSFYTQIKSKFLALKEFLQSNISSIHNLLLFLQQLQAFYSNQIYVKFNSINLKFIQFVNKQQIDIFLVDRKTQVLQYNNISAPSGLFIEKYIYLEYFDYIVLFTNLSIYAQIYVYDYWSLQNIAKVSGSFASNQIGNVVDMFFDYSSIYLAYLDTYGNIYMIRLYDDFSILNNYKITEVFDRNEQLVGFSFDNITNNLLVYSTNTIYQIDISQAGYSYEVQQSEPSNLFTLIPLKGQTLNFEFLFFNNDNVLFRYSKQKILFEDLINNSQIIDLNYYDPYDTLLIALIDSILLYKNYQNLKANNDTPQFLVLEQIQFFKFLQFNLILTYDKKIIYCDILTGQIIDFVQLQAQVVVTSHICSADKNKILIGLSNGQVLHYDLNDLSQKYYNIQNTNQFNTSIISIILVEIQYQNQIAYSVTNGGILLIVDITQKKLVQELNLIDLAKEDPSIILKDFALDYKYSRYIFVFNGQKKAYVWNFSINKLEKSLVLTKKQGNQLKLINNYLIAFCTFQLNIFYVSDQISLLTIIKRNFAYDQITDYQIINDNIVVIFFIIKYEVFLIQKNSNRLIFQQFYSNPRYLGSIYNQEDHTFKLYGLHETGVFENNFSISLYDSDQIKQCSTIVQDNDVSQLNQKIKSISPKQDLQYAFFGSTTENQQDWINIIQLSVKSEQFININRQINDQYLTNSIFLFYPQQESNNLLITNETFSYFQQSQLLIFNYNLVFLNQQQTNATINNNIETVIWQNITIYGQCLDKIQINLSNINTLIFQSIKIQQLFLCSKNTRKNPQLQFFSFQNISQIFIYDLQITSLQLDSRINFTLFNFNQIQSISIDGLNITKNQNISSLFQFIQINNIMIKNINLIENSNFMNDNNASQVSYIDKTKLESLQSDSVFNFFGCEQVIISNSLFQSNNQIQLIKSFSKYLLNNQLTVLFDDIIELIDLQIISNINPNQYILMIQSSYVSQSNVIYQQNQGAFIISQSQNVSINESQYSNNYAQNGGAIHLSNIYSQISFTNCLFQNNTAQSSGGALYFEDIGSTQIYFDLKTLIKQNKALIGGGLRIVQTNLSSLILPSDFPFKINVIENNASIYGDNSATYLQKLVIQNANSKESQNGYSFRFYDELNQLPQIYKKQYSSLVDIKDFQSGGQLQLKIQIVDNYNRYLSFSLEDLQNNQYPSDIQEELKSIQITINNLNTNQTQLIGERILNYIQFDSVSSSFLLTGLQVQGALQSLQYFSLDSNIYSNSQIQLPILLQIYFRECLIGEIIEYQVNQIMVCKICSQGQYSLLDPQLLYQQSQEKQSQVNNQCKNCPQSAKECQGSIIQLKNGYWRQNNLTDEIVECNSQIESCQAENPSSINLCKIGYIGPLCQGCDNLGEIWHGIRYSETTKQGECSECSPIIFEQIYFLLKMITMIIYFTLATFKFISQFKYTQTCYYLRQIKLLPVSKSSIDDYSGFYLKIIINYYQLSSLLISQPQIIKVDINFLNIFFGQTNRYLSLGVDCMFSADRIRKYGKVVFFSLVQFLVIFQQFFFTLLMLKTIQLCFSKKVKTYHFLTFFHIFLIFFQISQISYFVKSLTCKFVGSQSLNPYDLNTQCHDQDTVKFVFPYSIFMLFFWTIMPIFFLIKIYQNKLRLDECRIKYLYGYYYGEMKKQHFYWEFVRIYLKIILIYIQTLLSQTSQFTQNSILIIIAIYLMSLKKLNPFISQSIHSSEMQGYSLLILKIYLNSINSDSNNLQKFIEIVTVLIDYIFILICGFTIAIHKAKKINNLSSKFIRFLLKIFLTKKQFEKQIASSKTSFKTFLKWKFVQKNLIKILQLKISQNINIVSLRQSQRVNSIQTDLQQSSFIGLVKRPKLSQSNPFQYSENQIYQKHKSKSIFRQKQITTTNQSYQNGTVEIIMESNDNSELNEFDSKKQQIRRITSDSPITNYNFNNLTFD